MLQAILFDLDGTLLPMDNDYFVKVYFGFLAKKATAWGYTEPDRLIRSVWDGVTAMVKNDGSRPNCEAFWNCFAEEFGDKVYQDIPLFNEFYANEFHHAREATFPAPLASRALELARRKAEHVILATNPIFPKIADISRLSWIGLKIEDFDLVTDYENSRFSKPNPRYYRDILSQFQLDPSRCLMVGNDVDEDVLAAGSAGIPCYLLDDYIINRKNADVTCPRGSYEEMVRYLEKL